MVRVGIRTAEKRSTLKQLQKNEAMERGVGEWRGYFSAHLSHIWARSVLLGGFVAIVRHLLTYGKLAAAISCVSC